MSEVELKLVHGVGVKDMFRATNTVHYRIWSNMLARCYYDNVKEEKKKTYSGDTVAPEWHKLSDFYAWLNTIRGFDDEVSSISGKCLDKNLIIPCSSVFGPKTCVFVDKKINKLTFLRLRGRDDDLPIGLRKDKSNNFSARFSNKYIGTCETALDAHMLWLNARIDHLKAAAKEFKHIDLVGSMLLERHVALMQEHYNNGVEFKPGEFLVIPNDNINDILAIFYKDNVDFQITL
ncbi:hypothetical protein [Aeromonas caviae]|jgi:hypothetical protein|uniref:hypothetical protein n=1 Tax=Aeromonas caviae TaxID=648 RepID=UPI003858AE1A